MKKIFLVLFMSLMTQTALAFDNPITDSYGEWVGAGSLIVVSKQGLKEWQNQTEICLGEEYDLQKLTSISGKKLLKDIDKAIVAPTNKKQVYDSIFAHLEIMKTFINKDQNYKGILVSSKCGGGYEKFVLLTPNTGIYIYSEGEEDYYLLRKRK